MKLIFTITFICISTLFWAVDIKAATFTVTNTNDDGIGSLRYSISQANSTPEEDTIVFDSQVFNSPKTISLTSGQITITYSLNIDGPGANLLTISGNNQSRIFFNNFGSSSFTIKNLTLTKGFADNGGAVYIAAALNLSNLIITDNKAMGSVASPAGFYAGLGGGIYSTGSLKITNSVISNNLAGGVVIRSSNPSIGDYASAGGGGGIFGYGSQTTIVNCTFAGNIAKGMSSPVAVENKAGGQGGGAYGGAIYGIFNSKIINSTFINNSAVGGNGASVTTNGFGTGNGGEARGGAIKSNGTIILNSTFSNNSSVGGDAGLTTVANTAGNGGNSDGGAITDGDLKMANTTIADNTVIGGNGRIAGNGFGGGVIGGSNQWSVINSTITGNRVTGGTGTQTNGISQGGGIYSSSETGQASAFHNNIVAENFAASGTDIFGNYINANNNLIRIGESSTGITDGLNGNLVGTADSPLNPMLAPLQDNGGLTKTRDPLSGSRAINAGNNSRAVNPINSQILQFDQRGLQRIVPTGGAVDIGAFEFGASIAPMTASPDLQASSDTGLSEQDNITRATMPIFDILNVVPGATVELLRNNVGVSSAVATSVSVSLTDLTPPTDAVVQYTSRQTIGGITSQVSSPLEVTFDNTSPTVTINQSISQSDPAANLPILFTVVFSELVSNFDGQSISLAGSTADVSNASIFVSRANFLTYTVEISGIRSPGQIIATIPAGVAYDRVINYNIASTSTDNSVNFQPNKVEVSVSGRVRKSSGLIKTSATITLTDTYTGEIWTARTNPFGYYNFTGLKIFEQIGSRFSIRISNKSFVYNAPQPLTITGSRNNLNFTIQ